MTDAGSTPPSADDGRSARGSAPGAGVARLAVRLTKDATRQVRGRHPWVFDESVTSVKPDGVAGDLAVIFDDRRDFLAIGLYDPGSPIRIKVLHTGRPVQIDGDFWRQRLSDALDRRAALAASTHTTGYRWVHGENDQLPGLVIDRYDDTAVLKLYSEAWFPHLDQIVAAIADVGDPATLVLRLARNLSTAATSHHDGEALIGELPTSPVRFLERDLVFEADVVHGQKTGHFLDQRDNRLRVRALASGARVLDVYCCTGGFSVNAAAGGAALVHSVDISEGAIAAVRRNLEHNIERPAVRHCNRHQSVGDAMAVMSDMIDRTRRFDVVIVDPPSFASRQSQVQGALRAYGRLTELAIRLLEPGGTLVQASCSARVSAEQFFSTVDAAAAQSGFDLTEVFQTEHALDHPIGFPQGGYLKAVFATVDRTR